MAVKNVEKSPRKKGITGEGRAVIDAFKQILLLSGPPEVATCQGHTPQWQKTPGQTWIIAGYEAFTGEAYSLPVAGPGCSLRSILATMKRDGVHDRRPGHFEIFDALSEGKLIQILKDFSLIIFTNPDDKSWIRTDGAAGQKFIALRQDQLAPSGRFGRMPLPILIEKYARHIFRHGIASDVKTDGPRFDFEQQFMKEHRWRREFVDNLEAWVMIRRQLFIEKKRGELRQEEIKEAVDLFTIKARK